MFSNRRAVLANRRVVLALVAGTLFLAACGQLPRPFARDADDEIPTELLRPADGAGLVVDASQCTGVSAPALTDAVIEALRRNEVPAVAVGGNQGSLWLLCHDAATGGGGALAWILSDADGATIGGFEQAAGGGVAALGDDVARRVVVLLGHGVRSEAPRPSLVVTAVAGAPGNGEVALTRAMEMALEWRGATLAAEPDDRAFLVLGSVVVSDAESGAQRVEVVWEVLRPDGQRLGVVSQANTVPHGALDGEWGPIAAAIAQGAAQGVIDLLDRIAP